MEKEIAEFLQGDFLSRFNAYLLVSPQLNKCVKVDQNFIQLIFGDLPPLESFLGGASGKIEEKVFFDGFLCYRIIYLAGTGKVPLSVLDCMVDSLAHSYGALKKIMPAINVKEEN